MKSPYSLLLAALLLAPAANAQLRTAVHSNAHLLAARQPVAQPLEPAFRGGVPPNDACTGATEQSLAVGGTISFFGENTGATVDISDGGTDYIFVWHAFTTTECANVTINYCVGGSEFTNFMLNLTTSCPDILDGLIGSSASDACTVTFADLPAGTWYIPVLVSPPDTPDGPYEIAVSAEACVPVEGYCIPTSATGPDEGDFCDGVSLGSIDNTGSGYTEGVTYVDNTTLSTTLEPGMTYTIEVTSGSYTEDMMSAWIDYNGDEVFDESEKLGEVITTAAFETQGLEFTVPVGAQIGSTRLRVRVVFPQDGEPFPGDPCFNYTWGETEDYTVQISSGGGPANDNCDGVTAESLAVGGMLAFSGDNTGATVDINDGGTDYIFVWHAFTTTECANVTINYCVAGSEFTNFMLNLTSSCPDILAGLIGSSASDACTVTFADLPAGTWYIPVLVSPPDTPDGAYTIEVSAEACVPVEGYCIPTSATGPDEGDFCDGVSLGSIDNTGSGYTEGVTYVDNTSQSTTLERGATYTIEVTSGTYEEDMMSAWIDYNGDEVFDESEKLGEAVTTGAGETQGFEFTVPVDAQLGSTRLRVRVVFPQDGEPFPGDPCFDYTWGETEDYTVGIINAGGGPINDECGSVNTVGLATGATITFTGTTAGATVTNDFVTGSALTDPTVWHAFTTTECATVTISYCDTDPAFGNVWTFLSPSCPADENTVILPGTSDFTTCEGNITMIYPDLPAGTYYLPVLFEVDNANGEYSIDVAAVACVSAAPYCNASTTNISPDLEKIANVTFAGINNNSTSAMGYEDFTSVSGSAGRGMTYSFEVTAMNPWDEDQLLIWIDMDQSLTFDNDELVHSSAVGAGPYTGDISIPFDAALGNTRVRFRLHDTHDGSEYDNTPNGTPCGNSTFGQVEDYTLSITIGTDVAELNAADWSVFPNPNNGDFTVVFGGADTDLTLEVLDMTGRLVHTERKHVVNGQQLGFQLAGRMAAGSYMLRLTSEMGRTEQRIVVR